MKIFSNSLILASEPNDVGETSIYHDSAKTEEKGKGPDVLVYEDCLSLKSILQDDCTFHSCCPDSIVIKSIFHLETYILDTFNV